MRGVRILDHRWRDTLGSLVSKARSRLTIVAPFVTTEGSDLTTKRLHPTIRESGAVDVITDLSPQHVFQGALETDAVDQLIGATKYGHLWHIPKLHAKVYVADSACAIVTSGNLTAGGLYRNVEYGVEITNRLLLRQIESDLVDFRYLGTLVKLDQLQRYSAVARRVRQSYENQERRMDRRLREAFNKAVREAEDELVRFRLAGGAMHTVFGRTVLHLLHKHGPMPTKQIHEMVKRIHPDLCDDTVDRVIDGKHYGKKWKHAVRTAQQQLKRSNDVRFDSGLWQVTNK